MGKALMTHIYYGDPDEEFSLNLGETLLKSGTDILEIGIPYTDPVCDGEVFQRACKRAIDNRVTPFKVLEGISKLRKKGYKQKIYLTSYFGVIFKIGIEKFINEAKKSRVDGLIVPDILLEEQGDLQKICDKYRLPLIQFATVYSTKDRLKKICQTSKDFIYCISVPGVTGDDNVDRVRLQTLIQKLQIMSANDVYVGFGIDSAQKARQICDLGADGVIIGSAIARIYEKYIRSGKSVQDSFSQVKTFVNSINIAMIRRI